MKTNGNHTNNHIVDEYATNNIKPYRRKYSSDFVPKFDNDSATLRRYKQYSGKSIDKIGEDVLSKTSIYGNFNKELYM